MKGEREGAYITPKLCAKKVATKTEENRNGAQKTRGASYNTNLKWVNDFSGFVNVFSAGVLLLGLFAGSQTLKMDLEVEKSVTEWGGKWNNKWYQGI